MFCSFEARRGFHDSDGGWSASSTPATIGVAMHIYDGRAIDAAQALKWNLVCRRW